MTNQRRYTVWEDQTGKQILTALYGNASLSTVVTDLGAKSVGAILYNTESADLSPTQSDTGGPYDDVVEVATLLFHDASGYIIKVILPMPAASIFLSDNVTVDESQITSIKSAVIGTVLSAGGLPATGYRAGYRSSAGNQPAGIPPAGVTPNTLGIDLSGTLVGTEPALNFIPGTGVSLTVTDNPGSNRVDATIAAVAGSGGWDYLIYQDQKTSGTTGGTFTSGAWRTRTINTEVADNGNHGTLASNQVTLQAGTYLVHVVGNARQVDRHAMRIQDVTNNVTKCSGMGYTAGAGDSTDQPAHLVDIFTLSGSAAIEVQHQAQTTGTFGLAMGTGFTVAHECYLTMLLWKVA